VSFNFGSIASPTTNVFQLQKDLFQYAPVASTAASIPVSPSWSEVGLTYQININNSDLAIQYAFRPIEDILPPPSPLLYHDVPVPPAGVLFDTLLTVARNELYDLQHQSLTLLTNIATYTANFDRLVEDILFIEEVENIPLPISAVLPARSLLPEYIVRSPTPPLRYPSPVAAAATIQPPPAFDFTLFPNLFAEPPCLQGADTHPHLYTVVYEAGKKIWCPQDEYIYRNPLGIIPRVEDLDNLSPFYITPFRALTYHKVHIPSNVLPAVTICAKVG